MKVAALMLSLALIAALGEVVFSQPIIFCEGVRDVEYDGQLYLSLANGTLVAYSNGVRVWGLTFDYGAPALLAQAPPHGILVLTDAAWLGLITRDGRPKGWVKLNIDTNAIARGKLLYSNGLALIYAGRTAVVVNVSELKPLGYYSIKNTFLSGSFSPRGDSIVLLGFDTLCSACIRNEDKLVLVVKPVEGKQLFRAVVSRLRDAAVLWNRNQLVLAKWDAMYVYDLGEGGLEKPVKVYTYAQPVGMWLSWGFSPSGSFFHYIFADNTSLKVVVVDVETGSSVSRSLPLEPSTHVLSSLDDDCKIAVLSGNAPSEAVVLVGDATGVVRVERASGLGVPRAIKIAGDRAIAVFSNAFLTVPFLPRSTAERERPPLAYLMVKVVDREGRPFQEAFICANTSCAAASPEGAAAFVLREGTYVLTVRHPRAREFQAEVRVQGNVTRVVVLERLYRLVVNTSDGAALGACAIRVYDRYGGRVDEAASCTIVLTLPEGTYTVEIETPRHRIVQPVAIDSDTVLHFAILEKATVAVSAVDESGKPLHDATISVLDSRNAAIASAQGHLASELTAGRYVVLVQRPGYLNWSVTLELNGSLSIEAQLTRIPQAARVTDSREFSRAQVIAASIASSLATAGLIVAAHRFNIVKLVGSKRAAQASFKRRMGRR